MILPMEKVFDRMLQRGETEGDKEGTETKSFTSSSKSWNCASAGSRCFFVLLVGFNPANHIENGFDVRRSKYIKNEVSVKAFKLNISLDFGKISW